MARKSLSRRLGAVLVVCGMFIATVQAASAQRDDAREGRRVQPPAELLREYPFRQGQLRSQERFQPGAARAGGGANSAQVPVDPSADGGGEGWVSTPLVLGAASALLVLVAMWRRVARATAGDRDAEPDLPPPERGQEPEPDLPPPERAPRERRFGRRRTDPLPSGRNVKSSYAVANQKGGVGKTTVCLVLGVAAARRGNRVLLVDLDPQASATMVLGGDDEDRLTVADVMLDPSAYSLGDTVVPTEWGLDLAPAEPALRAVDTAPPTPDEAVLPWQLETVGDYDLVLFDCPPNLGALTLDALTAASRALVVTEPTFLAFQAMDELLDTLWYVTAEYNPSLELAGVVLNRVEATAEHKRGVAELEDAFGSQVWEPHIPKRAVLQDAMRRGVPPQDLQTHSAAEIAELFDALAQRLEASRGRS